ncbi:hypothetical protein D3C81_1181100 [compost metagenome]
MYDGLQRSWRMCQQTRQILQRQLHRCRQPTNAKPTVKIGRQTIVHIQIEIAHQWVTFADKLANGAQISYHQAVDRQPLSKQQSFIEIEMLLRHHPRQAKVQLGIPLQRRQFLHVFLRKRPIRLEYVTGQIEMIGSCLQCGFGLCHVIHMHGYARNNSILPSCPLLLLSNGYERLTDSLNALLAKLPLLCRRAEHLARAVELARPFISPVDVGQPRTAKRVPCREITLAVFVQQLRVPAAIKANRIVDVAIDRVPIRLHEHDDECRVTHASFDLEGGNPTVDELRNVLVHEHVFDGQRVFRRIDVAVFFHTIIPTARLQAFAPVATHAEHHRAKIAVRPMHRAHIPMHEVL